MKVAVAQFCGPYNVCITISIRLYYRCFYFFRACCRCGEIKVLCRSVTVAMLLLLLLRELTRRRPSGKYPTAPSTSTVCMLCVHTIAKGAATRSDSRVSHLCGSWRLFCVTVRIVVGLRRDLLDPETGPQWLQTLFSLLLLFLALLLLLLSDFQGTKTFISQPIVIKLPTQIDDNIIHNHIGSDFQVKSERPPGATNSLAPALVIYATADEADAYMFYWCFFCLFFCFFLFFSVRQKNTRQPFSGTAERNLMNLLPNDSWENVVSNVVPKWGLGPNNFLGGGGLKTTHCALGGDAWRMNRKNYFMLVCWLRHCALYGGCVKNAWMSECI